MISIPQWTEAFRPFLRWSEAFRPFLRWSEAFRPFLRWSEAFRPFLHLCILCALFGSKSEAAEPPNIVLNLAEVLQSAGYSTGGIGKWSLGDAGTEGRATAQGFDTFFGYLNQDHAHYSYPEYLDDDEGRQLPEPHPPLYWDYGHCRGNQYAQAIRLGNWKAIRSLKNNNVLELYDLESDLGESTDLAKDHPDVVEKITALMDTAVTPDPRYEIGTTYKGSPIWKKE